MVEVTLFISNWVDVHPKIQIAIDLYNEMGGTHFHLLTTKYPYKRVEQGCLPYYFIAQFFPAKSWDIQIREVWKGMSSTDQRVQVDHLRIWIRQMSQEMWRHVSSRHKLSYSRPRLLPKHRRQMAMA
jgi:hypothetical protein